MVETEPEQPAVRLGRQGPIILPLNEIQGQERRWCKSGREGGPGRTSWMDSRAGESRTPNSYEVEQWIVGLQERPGQQKAVGKQWRGFKEEASWERVALRDGRKDTPGQQVFKLESDDAQRCRNIQRVFISSLFLFCLYFSRKIKLSSLISPSIAFSSDLYNICLSKELLLFIFEIILNIELQIDSVFLG